MDLVETEGQKWGIDNDFAALHNVLLGTPEFYRWVDAGPIIGRTMAKVLCARFI